MSQRCRLLDWDTAFFGRRIATVEERLLNDEDCHAIDEWCNANAVECLYFLADPSSPSTIASAERAGFALKDVRVTLRHVSLDSLPLCDTGAYSIRQASPADMPQIERLAGTSHRGTRFYSDSEFGPAAADLLYQAWIRKAVADAEGAVFVVDCEGEAVGYVTCGFSNSRTANIGLLAVAESVWGRGIGRALVHTACRWFRECGAAEASVVTQGGNRRAIRLYERVGFRIESILLWYHKWYRPITP